MAAFVDRVGRRFKINAAELAFLQALQAHPVRVTRGQLIAKAGERADHAFVLMAGWAMSYSRFSDGVVHGRRLHFPGDLLAMPSVPMHRHAEHIEALSNSVISAFPKRFLAGLFSMPRLAAIMFMFAQAERITAGDRLANLGGNSAKGRVAFLLLDILHRLRSADATIGNTFYMNLTREHIAEFSGITPVHASRMWSALIHDRLIACEGRMITIVDEPALARLSHYRDRGNDFDHHWLKLVEEQSGASAALA